ncbi:MAG: hypothetical protein ATN35_02155 [Epulopiscium sp. Nele67-Bin004]|nr:MAG: hypothetical protein ATN35_02155 [Epulopiscium sp. Nele67-Bin004]
MTDPKYYVWTIPFEYKKTEDLTFLKNTVYIKAYTDSTYKTAQGGTPRMVQFIDASHIKALQYIRELMETYCISPDGIYLRRDVDIDTLIMPT